MRPLRYLSLESKNNDTGGPTYQELDAMRQAANPRAADGWIVTSAATPKQIRAMAFDLLALADEKDANNKPTPQVGDHVRLLRQHHYLDSTRTGTIVAETAHEFCVWQGSFDLVRGHPGIKGWVLRELVEVVR